MTEYIYQVPLPSKVTGMTVVTPEETIIFVNENLCEEIKERSLLHELVHEQLNHAFDVRSVAEIEEEAG